MQAERELEKRETADPKEIQIEKEMRSIIRNGIDQIPQEKIDAVMNLYDYDAGIRWALKNIIINELLREINLRPVEKLAKGEEELKKSLSMYVVEIKNGCIDILEKKR